MTWDDAVADQHKLVRLLRPGLPDNAACLECEYFDLGGDDEAVIGDCHNRNAEAFQRRRDEICRLFVMSDYSPDGR